MQGEKQRAIAEFFGEANQILKAHEEMDELQEAFENYLNNQNKDTLEHALLEILDVYNVLSGIFVTMGGKLDKIAHKSNLSLERTIEIINTIPPGVECRVKAYDQERYSGRYD